MAGHIGRSSTEQRVRSPPHWGGSDALKGAIGAGSVEAVRDSLARYLVDSGVTREGGHHWAEYRRVARASPCGESHRTPAARLTAVPQHLIYSS